MMKTERMINMDHYNLNQDELTGHSNAVMTHVVEGLHREGFITSDQASDILKNYMINTIRKSFFSDVVQKVFFRKETRGDPVFYRFVKVISGECGDAPEK